MCISINFLFFRLFLVLSLVGYFGLKMMFIVNKHVSLYVSDQNYIFDEVLK
jgi:hypothetical protein